jgi:Resolvase, N terminal domain
MPPWEAFPQLSRVLVGRMLSLLVERMVHSAAGALRTGVLAMSGTTRLLSERAEGKIGSRHRDRLAVVYVRQSTAAQVADHAESTRAQYGLADRAVTLGWARSRVLVIDEDLGHSAAGIDARPGFARLVSEVGLDHIGIVLGIDMSRLARSGREWHQLLSVVRAVWSAAGRCGRGL